MINKIVTENSSLGSTVKPVVMSVDVRHTGWTISTFSFGTTMLGFKVVEGFLTLFMFLSPLLSVHRFNKGFPRNSEHYENNLYLM